jgi:hypothetical protein
MLSCHLEVACMSDSAEVKVPAPVPRDPESVHRDIARAERLYDISVRDYFSTFATYSTAATILVAALSFPGAVLSPLHTATIALIGLYLCIQWHVSTAVMRDQYRYFIRCIEALEASLDPAARTFSHWQRAQDLAQLKPASAPAPDGVATPVAIRATWPHRQLRGLLGMRAAAFPALYGVIFTLIAAAQAPAILEEPRPLQVGVVLVVLAFGFLTLLRINRQRRP